MRFYDYSDTKIAEYKRRIAQVKDAHPYTRYPSEQARTLLPFAMYLRDKNAINMAAQLGDTKLCQYLYHENSDIVNTKYPGSGNTPLMNAVERKRLGTAEWLLQHGAKILPNKKGWNPVLLACHNGCIPALNMFKHYGVDFNQPFSRWEWKKGLPRKHLCYPIEIAILSNQTKAVQWLFDHGVNVNDTMEKGYSVHQMLAAKPEYFTQEIKEIITKKMFDESQQAIQDIQTHHKKRPSLQPPCANRTNE